MCGIAGVASDNASTSAVFGVRAMLPALARRRPDAEGLHYWPGADVATARKPGFTIPVELWRGGWVGSCSLAGAIDGAIGKAHIPQRLWLLV
jgi:hypothetical protein